MREANYKTLAGAKRYFKSLAKDFEMDKKWIEKIEAAESISEVEHIWKDALETI